MKFDRNKTIEVYSKKGCNVSATCSALQISRQTFYRHISEDEEFAIGIKNAFESVLDNVESKLLSKINDGDTTSLIFFLKTKGKKRGYVERQEITGANGEGLDVRIEIIGQSKD